MAGFARDIFRPSAISSPGFYASFCALALPELFVYSECTFDNAICSICHHYFLRFHFRASSRMGDMRLHIRCTWTFHMNLRAFRKLCRRRKLPNCQLAGRGIADQARCLSCYTRLLIGLHRLSELYRGFLPYTTWLLILLWHSWTSCWYWALVKVMIMGSCLFFLRFVSSPGFLRVIFIKRVKRQWNEQKEHRSSLSWISLIGFFNRLFWDLL